MIEYYEDESGEWRWRLKGANGEIVCTGEGHRDRHDAQRAVGIEPGWYALCGTHTIKAMEYGKRAELDFDAVKSPRKIARNHQQGTKDGWVYYAKVGDSIKIGFAADVKKRMRAYPPGTLVLAAEPGDKKLERQRHKEFNHSLIDGREWFRESLPIREHINKLRAQYGDTRDLSYVYRKHNRDGSKLKHTDMKSGWKL